MSWRFHLALFSDWNDDCELPARVSQTQNHLSYWSYDQFLMYFCQLPRDGDGSVTDALPKLGKGPQYSVRCLKKDGQSSFSGQSIEPPAAVVRPRWWKPEEDKL